MGARLTYINSIILLSDSNIHLRLPKQTSDFHTMSSSLSTGSFQTLTFHPDNTVIIQDKIYGEHTISEPVLAELLRCPALLRLAGIGLHGQTDLLGITHTVTRLEHSIGASLLVRKVGGSIGEQVAGLLHDISHTVLSHDVDGALSKPGESYHEVQKSRYIMTTELPRILTKHGFVDLKPFDEELYPLVERPAPHLCADRLDYSLRDAVAFGKLAIEDARRVYDSLTAFPDASSPHRLLVLRDIDLALAYARAYGECDRDVWCNPAHAVMSRKIGQLIGDLVQQGSLKEEVLWNLSDREFWELLKSKVDSKGLETIKHIEAGPHAEDYHRLPRGTKIRTIDPDLLLPGAGQPSPLSFVKPEWAKERQDFIQAPSFTVYINGGVSWEQDSIQPQFENNNPIMSEALTNTDLQGALPLIARGKVRDLYDVDEKTLLFVATDRISAYDVIMENGIPEKGILLTLCTKTWFKILSDKIPSLRTHFLTLDLPPQIPESLRPVLQNRSMQVRKLKILPIEAIVRGYITGSAWNEYKKSGTVHGIKVAEGLRESEAFPDGPIYTPSTKAEQGEHDENIHPDQAVAIVGERYASKIASLAVQLYKVAHEYALTRGVIIADTKFEFGLDPETDEVVLADEVLTPDSSRFWPKDSYEIGRGQQSFDKQFLRDWLTSEGLKGKPGVRMTDEIAQKTSAKYREAYERITGETKVPAV
ncbi:phosphoribosylamidoimidazole-succinocarboxamidesynthase [Aspergillus oryzae 100-8]|uniref:Phosphoribosylaminoimidazole-succinocarboxamide synthase n=1 Tax=Aspergillus oryzae (strain 3.042) TaxID=1160506 RepID=I8IPH7_ASPO3|nr:phosphoribosylamidoimidazole-succinocarboxamidesynthase [Aspergillus oryzae 3.042]KDE75106.1 phosphoribosylamidoimidazole-succinocarboxamidesynthase [Aspergillus oryzae 100-8]|eukprot:EIT81211.1 phosphoribosylamidoimidazole-succinocarboxamidesynthase [Aspergillus oryzae 3.042]